jgi:hypothetical protein
MTNNDMGNNSDILTPNVTSVCPAMDQVVTNTVDGISMQTSSLTESIDEREENLENLRTE